MEDNGIIELYFSRSEQAIAETDRKYGGFCYSIAYNVLFNREDSEESVSDTYLSAWNAIPPTRPRILSSFLGKITRNLSLDKWRRRTAAKRGGGEVPLALEELSECLTKGDSTWQEVEAHELTEAVSRFLETLPAPDRQLFLGRYWYCRSIGELSAIFSLRESAVKTRLFRLRGKLREFLEKEGIPV